MIHGARRSRPTPRRRASRSSRVLRRGGLRRRPVETRPGFSAMLERLLSNGVRTIVVETANRFARDLIVQETGYAMLKARGIELIAADKPDAFLDDTPTATLIRQILGAVCSSRRRCWSRSCAARASASARPASRSKAAKSMPSSAPKWSRWRVSCAATAVAARDRRRAVRRGHANTHGKPSRPPPSNHAEG